MVLRPRNGISLCAGAGGLDMGLMLAELGFHTRCFVEWEEYPRSTIIAAQKAGYFAPAPIWDDVRTFDGKPLRGTIDTILAGYPCQPFSHAGKRRGEDDPRHLWPDIARVIREVKPSWVFLENVAGHVSLGAETVLRELQGMGFTPASGLFTASEVGATHQRKRWFCVAYSGSPRLEGVSPDQRHAQGRKKPHGSTGLQGGTRVFPPGPDNDGAWAEVIDHSPNLSPATSFRDCKHYADGLAQDVASGKLAQEEAESAVRRMVNGLASRSRALRLLGNGVVPLEAAYAWRTLALGHGLQPYDMGGDS